ncbi:MAG: hypothetical protein AB7S38_39885 [Vulcanimicrobiota bacterium]
MTTSQTIETLPIPPFDLSIGRIRPGMTRARVEQLLKGPFHEHMGYTVFGHGPAALYIEFAEHRVSAVTGGPLMLAELEARLGSPTRAVARMLSHPTQDEPPLELTWNYPGLGLEVHFISDQAARYTLRRSRQALSKPA